MWGNRTFSIIKPGIVERNSVGEVLHAVEEKGFRIVAIKKIMLTKEQAQAFYGVHEGKEFYERLVKYMTSGPVMPMILEKENAVVDFRELIGSTSPELAKEGTIRKRFATSVTKNAIHGSDSDENAEIESAFFFSNLERF